MQNILCAFLFVSFSISACPGQRIEIANLSGTHIGNLAAAELDRYLTATYPDTRFIVTKGNPEAEIQYLLSGQAKMQGYEIQDLPVLKESYKIVLVNDKLMIIAADARGLLHATYALLEEIGHGFYLSGDVAVAPEKWKGFHGLDMEDHPRTGDRFVFNWHNFLSGCTGWNLEDWKMWIDQSNKMRFNGIMVHAYGNNPMFRFEYLGETKRTGYLNNTTSGRDWGNQHVNDVRRLEGGEIFENAVFGSEASLASESDKEKEATRLMQQVFEYAEEWGTNIIFALDFDTWMANPANIIKKLPLEAVFELDGHLTPNPEHPEGYKYYKQLLHSLLEMYPQIDQLAVWHRRPSLNTGLGTIWMKFPYEKFPPSWKRAYQDKLKNYPEIPNDIRASSMFAYGKLIKTLQEIRNKIKPELEISSGSWRFDFVKYADAFFPVDVPLLPLDWEVVFDQPESIEILTHAGQNRPIYPIIWAHHDDHRYIGRPYTPWDNLAHRLKACGASGFGIIHWTTRPLDLYFTSSAKQVWNSTINEPIKTTIKAYVKTVFNQETYLLTQYFHDWLTAGPMFGRETSDHFMDLGRQRLGHKLENWETMKIKSESRLKMLDSMVAIEGNIYWQYQRGMEQFYISFFTNQQLFQEAYQQLAEGNMEGAIKNMNRAHPDKSIRKYVEAIKTIGFTSGEKALVFSMNTRWKADFINLKQRLGMIPARYKFIVTQHDPLAQAPGRFSYHIDASGNWWRCLWKTELSNETFINKKNQTGLRINDVFTFDMKTMHGNPLPKGAYEIEISFLNRINNEEIHFSLVHNGTAVNVPDAIIQRESGRIKFNTNLNKNVVLKVDTSNPELLESIVIRPLTNQF